MARSRELVKRPGKTAQDRMPVESRRRVQGAADRDTAMRDNRGETAVHGAHPRQPHRIIRPGAIITLDETRTIVNVAKRDNAVGLTPNREFPKAEGIA